MRAVKENKVYTIDEGQKRHYQDRGYDILDDDGAVIAHARRKMVPYEEYEKVLDELNTLKASISDTGEQEEDNAPNELNSMSVDELKAYAEANEIPIGNSTSQAGILKKIREAEKEKA